MEENRVGRVAYIRYEGGILGERHVDKHLDEPLAVRIGAGRVVKGIDDALRTMEVGESATLIIPPEEGYGDADPKQIKWYPRSIIPHGYEIKKDTMIMWESADGLAKRPAMVVDATEDTVKIDMNHPYAGKTLEYWVDLSTFNRERMRCAIHARTAGAAESSIPAARCTHPRQVFPV